MRNGRSPCHSQGEGGVDVGLSRQCALGSSIHHVEDKIHGVDAVESGRYAVDGKIPISKIRQVKAYGLKLGSHLLIDNTLRLTKLDSFWEQDFLYCCSTRRDLLQILLVKDADVCPMLIDYH